MTQQDNLFNQATTARLVQYDDVVELSLVGAGGYILFTRERIGNGTVEEAVAGCKRTVLKHFDNFIDSMVVEKVGI